MSPKQKRTSSRVDHDFFDFNDTLHERAAAAVTTDQLRALFEALDRADERFGVSGDERTPTLEALKAIEEFLVRSPFNENGRFSRPFELLIAELKNRPAPKAAILPRVGAGSGAVNGRDSTHYVKAAAAFTAEFLHAHGKFEVNDAAAEVARLLVSRGFRYGGRRNDKAAAVKAWRRDFPRDRENRPGLKRPPPLTSRAALIFRDYLKAPPVAVTGDTEVDRTAVITWLEALLGRKGYGPVL